jgi:tRNA(Ile)-lysidine synthase
MLETIAAYIERHHLLPPSGEIIVAVSGGADSLCLLHLLHRLCGPGKRYPELRLHAAHLNHKLRGEASAQDAAVVAQIATAWGLPLTVGELDVPALARQERRSLEDAARTARYRFLREVARGQPIAVAHHADDQVETLLLHWLRGAGLAGMVGILPRQQDIIRPLLEVSHAQTVAYCQQHQIVPLQDASNTDPRFLRNRIRHELLPLLESLNQGIPRDKSGVICLGGRFGTGIRATLLRNAEVMRVDAEWIEAQVDASWPTVILEEQADSIRLNLAALLALPLSIQRHLLRRVTANLCAGQSPLELRHYTLIEQLLHAQHSHPEQHCHPERSKGSQLDLPHQLHVICEADNVVFERSQGNVLVPFVGTREASALLPIPGRVQVPGTPWIAIAEMLPHELLQQVQQALSREDWSLVWQLLPSTPDTVYVDAGVVGLEVGSNLQVRTRRPGDRIQPLGMAQEKKVQDILVDKHIPRPARSHIPLFFSASHCLWLAGVCLDDRVRLTSRTQHILRLSIT